MKLSLLVIPILFSSLALAASPSVELGNTEKETIDILGKPMGTIQLREKTLLLYPQGEITLRKDSVTEIDMMTDEEFEADQERLRIEREEWLANEAMRKATLKKEGLALKAEKLKSNSFAALPAKDRVDYWRSFQIRYPSIDVSEHIGAALQGYKVELEELKTQQRIAELEARVAEAEKDAALAQLEAKKAREELEADRYNNDYNSNSYGNTFVRRNYYYRPPTVTIYTKNHSYNKGHKKPKVFHHSPTTETPAPEPMPRGDYSQRSN